MTRREALKTAALATAGAAALPHTLAQSQPAPAPPGPFTLPRLPYACDALEPHLDARTMEIHHGKHHATYVANLNKALSELPSLPAQPIEALLRALDSLPSGVRTPVRNNGGGHLNHSLFWQMMRPNGGGQPKGELARAIAREFGSFAAFQDRFTKAALGQFGSGWAWLVEHAGRLQVVATPNQDTPVMGVAVAGCQGTPLLGLDVWEHAYYLKYQNRRADYVAAWWNVVNWDFVAERFARAQGA